jgi:hypothetical protein
MPRYFFVRAAMNLVKKHVVISTMGQAGHLRRYPLALSYCIIKIASREPYDYHVLQWYMWLLDHGAVLTT